MNVYTFPIENNLVAFMEGQNCLFLFNQTARLIWKYYSNGYNPRQIGIRLQKRFNISCETAQKDIDSALKNWRKQGLIGIEKKKQSANLFKSRNLSKDMGHIINSYPTINCIYRRRRYQIFGVSFEIGFQNTDLEAMIHPLFAHLESDNKTNNTINFVENHGYFIIQTGIIEAGRDPSVHQAIGILIQEIINLVYADSEWMAVLHASSIRNDKHAILFPAMGGSGKSTLTAALTSSGLNYLSDDVVPLECMNQHARSVPLSLCVKSGSWPALSPYFPKLNKKPVYQRYFKQVKYLHPPGSYKGKTRTDWPVNCLIFPRYKPNGPGRFCKIPPTKALRRIIDSGAWVSPNPENVRVFIDWITSVPSYDLYFQSLDNAISIVQEAIDS